MNNVSKSKIVVNRSVLRFKSDNYSGLFVRWNVKENVETRSIGSTVIFKTKQQNIHTHITMPVTTIYLYVVQVMI